MVCLAQSSCMQENKYALKSTNPPLFHFAMYNKPMIITIAITTMSIAPDSDPTHVEEVHATSPALVEKIRL